MSERDPERRKHLGDTWPFFERRPGPAFPADPALNVTPLRPDSAELAALEARTDLPETTERAENEVRRLQEAMGPGLAPEWARAARLLADWLEDCMRSGTPTPTERASVARMWASFVLGGATEPLIVRVAHLVSRAHSAIRASPRAEGQLQAAYRDCAGVLHSALPLVVRERMPFERVLGLVRRFHLQPDAWAAVVDGTSELLGWNDYARTHAASVIRTAIEGSR